MISKRFRNISIDKIYELLDMYSFSDVYDKCKELSNEVK